MIDTTFQPVTPNTYVGSAATQICSGTQAQQVSTFRVRNLYSATAYIGWGAKSGISAPAAPSSSTTQQPSSIGLATGAVTYIAVPPGSYFIASTGASFEVIGGNGGVGG